MRINSAHHICVSRGREHHVSVSCCHRGDPTGPRARAPVAIRQDGRKIRHVALPRSKFAFLTLPRYSMIALSSAVEPLRMANLVTGESVYDWSIVSIEGEPTPASNGLQLAPTVPLDKLGPVDILFVCGGVDVQAGATAKVLSSLRRL